MRVAHILRKYNPAEWGGTETALERLFDGHDLPLTSGVRPSLEVSAQDRSHPTPLDEALYRFPERSDALSSNGAEDRRQIGAMKEVLDAEMKGGTDEAEPSLDS